MWHYTDSLQELTTSINRLLTNDKENQVQDQTTSLFTLFDFSLQNEENLSRVDEYLNDETNFNVAVFFIMSVILNYTLLHFFAFLLQCYNMYFIIQ